MITPVGIWPLVDKLLGTLPIADPIVARFVVLVTGILLVAGLILGGLRLLFGMRCAREWRIWRSWWVMATIVLGAAVVGRLGLIVLLGLVGLAAFVEFARATGMWGERALRIAVILALLGMTIITAMPDPRTGDAGWYGLFMAFPAYVVALLVTIPVLRDRVEGQLRALAITVLGFVYIGWMFGHAAFLANASRTLGYTLFLLLAVALTDVAAYSIGRSLGAHPLRSAISPNKTWEGAIGAMSVAMLLPWLLGFTLPDFAVGERLIIGAIVGVGAQLGDLAISTIKRDLAIKDMGELIPGHGGILDRVDSLIFTAPLFFHAVR